MLPYIVTEILIKLFQRKLLDTPIRQIYGLVHMKEQESRVISRSLFVNAKTCLKKVWV